MTQINVNGCVWNTKTWWCVACGRKKIVYSEDLKGYECLSCGKAFDKDIYNIFTERRGN